MKKSLLLLLALALLPLAGCSTFGGKKDAITTEDLNQAQYVRNALNAEKDLRGIFTVTPGANVTTVTFNKPNRPASEEQCRRWMSNLKSQISQHMGKEANTLRFVFKDVVLEE